MLLDNVTFISYIGGSILFSALSLITLYLVSRQQLTLSTLMAMLLSAVWCGVLAIDSLHPELSVRQLLLLETMRTGAWISAMLQQLRFYNHSGVHRGPFLILNCLWVLCGFLFVLLFPLLLPDSDQMLYVWGSLLLSILGVVAVEQLFRNSAQYRISKFLSIGLAAQFLYDLYLFSHAALFGVLDAELWQARGAVSGSVAIFLAIGMLGVTGRAAPQPTRVAISRPVAFYTTSLTTAGFFLALMAAGGYYIKLYGGNWGTVIQITVITSSLVAIAIVFLSDVTRTKLSVFIDKHFFVHKYDYRSQWLNLIHHLSASSGGSGQDIHHRAIQAVASTFKCPGGMLWLNNRFGKLIPVAVMNMKVDSMDFEEPAESPFCRVLREEEWVFSPHAPHDHELGTHNEMLPHWIARIPGVWLIIPLLVDHELIGFLVLAAPAQESPLTWEDLDLLKTVGREVAVYLSRNEAAEMLAQSKQFDAYNKLTAFIMHDLKNLIAQQALVVENAAKHKENPAFIDDMIRTIDNSVQRMSNLLKKLQQTQPTSGRSLPLKNVVINSVKKCQDRVPRPSLRILSDSLKVVADEDNLEMIITHIIKNAQEATAADGYVDITLRNDSGYALIEVEDNGSGMDADFVKNRLFRPFDTTKSGKGMGIGVYQTREFIRNLGGDVTVKSEPGIGTTFTIYIPVEAQAKAVS